MELGECSSWVSKAILHLGFTRRGRRHFRRTNSLCHRRSVSSVTRQQTRLHAGRSLCRTANRILSSGRIWGRFNWRRRMLTSLRSTRTRCPWGREDRQESRTSRKSWQPMIATTRTSMGKVCPTLSARPMCERRSGISTWSGHRHRRDTVHLILCLDDFSAPIVRLDDYRLVT